MANVTQEQVVKYITGISVLELSELVKTLEKELGVSAATAMRSPSLVSLKLVVGLRPSKSRPSLPSP